MCKKFRFDACRMAMETMRACLQITYDLNVIYSPPRVVKEAYGMGMKGGFSLDVTNPELDGYAGELDRHCCCQRAFRLIRETRPYMVVGSPEYIPFQTFRTST